VATALIGAIIGAAVQASQPQVEGVKGLMIGCRKYRVREKITKKKMGWKRETILEEEDE
jgi:hypothetical protein